VGNGQKRQGSFLKRLLMISAGLVVVVGLGAPYWLGQQVEKHYADYLQRLQRFDYIQVENPVYERGWFQASASYELILEPELAQVFERHLTTNTGLTFEGEPLLRVVVNDRITHGPFMGALATFEGRAEDSGWLFEQAVHLGEDVTRYAGRVGFDQVVEGEWEPMTITLASGPLLNDMGVEMQAEGEFLGGEFRYDPGTGEFRDTSRLGKFRTVEPSAVHTFEGSTTDLVISFPQGVLREITLRSDEAPTLTESRNLQEVGNSRTEGQSFEVKFLFDEQGRFADLVAHFQMQGFESEAPDRYLSMDELVADFTAARQGDSSWYGQLGLSLDGLAVREQYAPGFTAQSATVRLGLEPESETHFQLAQLWAAEGLQIQGVEEPIAFHVESSYGQLSRTEYDTLWSLIYEAIASFQWNDPDALLPIFERMGEAGEALMEGRSVLTIEPATFSMGDADITLALEADLLLQDIAGFDDSFLLDAKNRLDLSVEASALLLHRATREVLRQQYNGMLSGNELDAMAKEVVAGSVEPMLDMGVVRREQDGSYTLKVQLQDGQLLVNGESGEWLLEQF
jgi:hypothetical protein